MSLHRRAAKRDDSEREVIDALEAGGATVQQLSGEGVPDLLVGVRGVAYLIEVKSGNKGLTPAQKQWHATWQGPRVEVVRNAAQARKFLLTASLRLADLLRSLPSDPITDQADGVREEE